MSRLAVLNKVSCVGLRPKVWLSAVYLRKLHHISTGCAKPQDPQLKSF